MNRRAVVLLLVLGILAAGRVEAQFNKAGRTAFQFVKIGVGARETALGESGLASVRDVNSVFWNPAGLSGVASTEAAFSYNTWFGGMKHVAGGLGVRVGGVGIVGLSAVSLNYGDIQEALVTGTSSDTRTGNTFTGGDLMAGVTFCREFSDRLSIGVTAKYLQEKLWIYQAHLFAFDVGTNYDTGFKGIRFGMSAQNFGKSVQFLAVSDRTEGYDIPLVFRIGASMDIVGGTDGIVDLGADQRFTLSVESVNSNDFGERWQMGGEYTIGDLLSIRGGYRFNYEE
ncbi:MAG TPA: PorV/PorQ family protein, partial [Bacteroidota bacterium]|nr:PorV/PorQ family protein [Bacteroidota bacterium]